MGLLNESLRLLCGGLPFRRRRFLPGFFLTIHVKHNTANYRADAENDCWNALVNVSAVSQSITRGDVNRVQGNEPDESRKKERMRRNSYQWRPQLF